MAGYRRIFNIAGSTAINRNLFSNRYQPTKYTNGLPNVQPCATLKAKALEKLGIPPKPKRPLTPYFKFMKTERSKVVFEEPNLRTQDVVKKMAHKWANYDPKEKEALQKAYDLELLAYSKQVMIYEQSMTPEQKKVIQNAREKQLDKEEKLKFKKKTEELGKPRKPPTAFIQYMQERSYSKSKDGKVTEWVRNIAEKWRGMTIEEKAKYQFESQKLMDQYRKDMREWEEKMVRLGHIEVVRNRGLIDLKANSAAKPE